MLVVPVQAVPNQTVTVSLGGQTCQIDLYQKATGLFVDLYVSNLPIVIGAVALDRNRIVRSAYLGFMGDLMIVDRLGTADPSYAGLGSRYALVYLTAAEIAA